MKLDLQPFVGLLTSRSRLNEAERRALLDLPTAQLQVEGRKDFVRPNETVSHVSVVVEGEVARFGQTADGERNHRSAHHR